MTGDADAGESAAMQFYVKNLSAQPVTLSVAAACYDKNNLPAYDCRLNVAGFPTSIAANDSAPVTVGISPAPGYVGNLYARLSATATVAGSPATYSYTDTLYSPHRARLSDIVVSPPGGPMAVPPGGFHVTISAAATTIGQRDISADVALDCGAFQCGWSGPGGGLSWWYPFTLHANGADTASSQPDFYSSAPGTHGLVILRLRMIDPVSGAYTYDSTVYNVSSGTQARPTISPKNPIKTVIARLAHVDTFTVRNSGDTSAPYAFSADCGSFSTTGCIVSPTSKSLAANDSVKVTVSYMPSGINNSTTSIRLIASTNLGDGTEADTSAVTATASDTHAPTIAIYPADGSRINVGGWNAATVYVCDDGPPPPQPSIQFNGSTVLASSYTSTPGAPGCTAGGRTTVFSINPVSGANTLSVTATDGYNTSTAASTFTYSASAQPTPDVTVTAPSSFDGNQDWVNIPFTFTNRTNVGQSLTLNVTCGIDNYSGEDSPCEWPSTIVLQPNETQVVNVTVYAYDANPGEIDMRATANFTTTAVVSVQLYSPPRPTVNDLQFTIPKSTIRAIPNGVDTLLFYVKNTSSRTIGAYVTMDCTTYSSHCGWLIPGVGDDPYTVLSFMDGHPSYWITIDPGATVNSQS
ncbi:MAG TPA: hypothetical protein VHV78_14315, partial [Gemmatimonadaceae bacterium]|nr:hypothetical protein [Gemmatimonadaceae bacterium]